MHKGPASELLKKKKRAKDKKQREHKDRGVYVYRQLSQGIKALGGLAQEKEKLRLVCMRSASYSLTYTTARVPKDRQHQEYKSKQNLLFSPCSETLPAAYCAVA